MLRHVLACAALMIAADAALAQSYPWGDRWSNGGARYEPPPSLRGYSYGGEPYVPYNRYYRDYGSRSAPVYVAPFEPDARWQYDHRRRRGDTSFLDRDDRTLDRRAEPQSAPNGQKLMDGGARPQIRPISPQSVSFRNSWAPGTIVIETKGRRLFLVLSATSAAVYPISVGRDGFTWAGTEKVSRIADWPDWHPPADMRARDPKLPEKMTGGLRNPLGARSLYLGETLYRIHGTNDANTIGHAASSGCFRMLNGHVVDLAERVKVGTPVVVLDRLPQGTTLPPRWPERPDQRPDPRRG